MKTIKHLIIRPALFLLMLTLLLYMCKREEFNFDNMSGKVLWEPSFALPLAYGSLTIDELLSEKKDTIEFSDPDENGRRVLTFVLKEDSLFSIQVSEFMEIPTQAPVSHEIIPSDLTIDNFQINDEFSLWDIVPNLDVQTGAFLLSNHGTMNLFPPIVLQNAGIHDITMADNFSFLVFSEGWITFSITNEFPVDLNDLQLILKNKSDYSTIGTLNFVLPAGSTRSQSLDLTGKTMTNDMYFEITSISSPGSGGTPILIDLDNVMRIKIETQSLKVSSGEAILPSQSMILDPISIDLSLSNAEMKLTKINLKDTRINYTVHSPIPVSMTIYLRMPSVTIEGEVVEVQIFIPESGGTVDGIIDLTGAEINLATDSGHPYNRIPTELSVDIHGVGWFIPFDLSQGFSFDFSFDDLSFSLAQGYFGQIIVNIDENEFPIGLDLLANLGGGFSLSDPSFSILAYSSLGVPIGIDLDVTGVSSDGITQNINYTGPQMILPYPNTFAQGYNEGILDFNKNNSAIDELIGLPPSTMTFSGSGTSNPNGFTGYNNFIADTSQIKLGVAMNFPITIKADNLTFQDTIALGSGNDEEGIDPDPEEEEEEEEEGSSLDFDIIQEASLYIDLTHDLPIDLSLDIILFDSLNYIKYDSIHVDVLVAAAYDDDGNLIEVSQHKEYIELDKSTISNFSKTNSIILKAGISTYDPGDGLGPRYVKLYSDYFLEFKLGIRVDMNFSDDK